MALKKHQWFEIIAIVLFFIGTVFVIMGTFIDGQWATWTGIAVLLVSFGFYMLTIFSYKKTKEKPVEEATETKKA